jgi:hypothetical protein
MRGHSRSLTAALAAAAVALPALAALGGCNPLRRQGTAQSNAPPVVVFENQSLSEAAVYVVPRGGTQHRIGTVQAGRTDTLRVSTSALGGSGSVTIVARLLAVSRAPSTGPLTLMPGDRIAVTLPPDARLLSVLPINR